MKIYRKLYSVHQWLGLTTGLFLLLLGLSGSILVFKEELATWSYADSNTVTVESHAIGLDEMYRKITQRYPNLDGIAWINPDRAVNQAYIFRLYLNDTQLSTYDLGLISINPYSGEVIRGGRSDDWDVDWLEWCFQFHFSFHQGIPGAAFAASMGILMLLSILTGALVYRKFLWKVLCFKVKIKTKNWRTLSSDLHRIVGVWAMLLNVIIFFTGFWMNLFAFKAETWHNEITPTPANTLVKSSLDQMYHRALVQMPDLEPHYVYLPTQAEKKFNVRGNLQGQNPLFAGGNRVRFDAQTGQLIDVQRFTDMPFWDQFEALFYPLHAGNYGGWFIKILYVLIGLTPGLLSITGFLLWWRKNK